ERRRCFGRPEWTWGQAGHRQDNGLAVRRAGFLSDQVPNVLADGFAQLPLEGRIDLGQGLGQVAEIMGLTKLIATGGEDLGRSRYQGGLLVAEHRENRPLQVRERLQEGGERRLILLRKPATSQGQAAGEFAD